MIVLEICVFVEHYLTMGRVSDDDQPISPHGLQILQDLQNHCANPPTEGYADALQIQSTDNSSDDNHDVELCNE